MTNNFGMTQNSVLNFCIPSGLIEGSKNKTNEAEIKLMKRLVQFYQLVVITHKTDLFIYLPLEYSHISS